MSEHSKEGRKLLKLLEIKSDWKYKKYYDNLTPYSCLENKHSSFLLVPVRHLFSRKIYVATPKSKYSVDLWNWEKSFFTDKDHRVIHKIASDMIKELSETISKENKWISEMIMGTKSSQLS